MAAETKTVLHRYLRAGREALLWKLDDLAEYDRRRPLVSSGTNLLGLVKHLAGVEAGYFGEVFGRPFPEPPPWMYSADPNVDMWANEAERTDEITGLYRRAIGHADDTIEALASDAVGEVPWWPPERRAVTLDQILVHMVAETHRHAGHADIVRELVDGAIGLRAEVRNAPPPDEQWWSAHRDRIEHAARAASPEA